jgi:omega-6 fatty acid desaturase (delta-12 desaturase)
MGKHYRADVEGGSLGFLKSLWSSARWCQWVEPSPGAVGEGKGVLFFKNRNGLGVPPMHLKEVKPKVGNAKMSMTVGADE